MKISMVIPTYTIDSELEELAIVCALSYREQVQELIICEDGGKFSEELSKIADLYVYGKKNEGFTKNVNKGWRLSTGDYTMIVNSDTQLLDGDLKDLCIPARVTCPIAKTENVPYFWGTFFCVPRPVKEMYGLLDERMLMYGSDSEYEKRIGHLYQPIQTVEIIHHLNQTTNKMDQKYIKEQQEIDRTIFAEIIKNEYKN